MAETEFWPDRPQHNHWKASEFPDYGRERIQAETFLALPMGDPGGNHVHWREMIDGRWWLCYRGSSCGFPFSFRHQPIVQIALGVVAAKPRTSEGTE